ncbi:cytadherence high molecular weight protein 2 [Anopheles cruzii]|uniref:cytadherence high molecular weight protein 2 n=1 Tax=Anopheles cruzii TaxID=68878 RepID=UPI0022EC7263|nr:cytadherence high molecular weight protein 2 [Anopheles cruzii]
MAWLKLNDSLNKVKGSITTFTQEVFAEGIIDDDGAEPNPVREIIASREKIDELMSLCSTQDQEIATLRKQVADYQQQLQHNQYPHQTSQQAGPSQPSTSKVPTEATAKIVNDQNAALEDSWFWDPENNVSSTSSSSKKDDNESPLSGNELTTIPLEPPANDGEIIERLQRQLNDKIQQLKKQQLENALLNEKLQQVGSENRELNENIEELDRQHEVVLENLVASKRELQERCAALEADANRAAGESKAQLSLLQERLERLEQSHTETGEVNAKLQAEVEKLTAELERIVCENVEAVVSLESQLDEKRREQAESSELYDELLRAHEELTQKTATEEPFVALPRVDEQEVQKLRAELEDMRQTMEAACTERDHLQKLTAELDRSEHIGQLEREIGALQNELRSVIIDNSVQLDAKEKDCDEKINVLRQENQALRESAAAASSSAGQIDPRLDGLVREFFGLDLTQIDALEQRFEQSRDVDAKLSALEKKLVDSTKEINFVKSENSRIQHDKDTLNADLMQYEKECSSLVKNNDLLIAEIENLKCNKLETINENAEDSIVVLEKQLEDSHKLNRSLEDEYREMNCKLEEALEEKEELLMKVASLESSLDDRKSKVGQLEPALRASQANEGSLLMQLEEMRQSGAQETDQLKLELESVQAQLATINEDHASLVQKLRQLQQSSSDSTRSWESKLHEMRLALEAKEADIQLAREATLGVHSADAELETMRNRLQELTDAKEQLQGELEKQKDTIENLSQQKENLVQLVTTKHNESVQYHAEIQRLNQLLQEQSEQAAQPCSECIPLREKVQDYERISDQMEFLREKCGILTTNLMTEQTNQRMVAQEKQELLEQKNGLQRDLDRLRQHLMELEEAHTQETVDLQQRYDETRHKLLTLEEEVKKSTNALTSASIRANQQAETLQTQYQLLQQQRDDLHAKLSSADDRDQKNQASLTNLQCALEQFQMNKERDIELATVNIRNDLDRARGRENQLKAEVKQLQQHLIDAKNGLLAAARISDQLEISQVTVASLKNELAKRDEKYSALEHRLQETEANQADKVEKMLLKNLIIGYVVAPNAADKQQIMKLISSVLTMDQADCSKVGLNRNTGAGGWLNTILGSASGGAEGNYNKESLTEAFVKFLEKESAPRSTDSSSLLNIVAPTASPPSVAGGAQIASSSPAGTAMPTATTSMTNPVNMVTTVKPILLPEAMLQQTTFQPARSSSSILKDILSDS